MRDTTRCCSSLSQFKDSSSADKLLIYHTCTCLPLRIYTQTHTFLCTQALPHEMNWTTIITNAGQFFVWRANGIFGCFCFDWRNRIVFSLPFGHDDCQSKQYETKNPTIIELNGLKPHDCVWLSNDFIVWEHCSEWARGKYRARFICVIFFFKWKISQFYVLKVNWIGWISIDYHLNWTHQFIDWRKFNNANTSEQ